MLITIVRHGQSVDNTKRRWSGITDCALTTLGFSQAEAAGKWLCNDKFTHIFSSDLQRARVTCEQIVKFHLFDGVAFHDEKVIDTDNSYLDFIQHREFLREQHFGSLEGKEYNLPEVRSHTSKLHDPTLTEAEKRNIKFPGPEGESRQDVLLRAELAWTSILKDLNTLKPLNSQCETHILIASHGAYIRELITAIANHPTTWCDTESLDSIRHIQTHNTGIWRLHLSSETPLRVLLKNSVEHLDAPVFTFVTTPSLSKVPYDPNQSNLNQYFQNQRKI
ncbi:hypothetical protein DSO57_1011292 [Entomophthora muscae]|uniref:Uncharacterized protein n=1 Tax=Entomophthora muscae TaxID=34485 RepID=A0ACC2TTR5_9FUNG|nr:hypothetical protein DSO57_1011292 [Entomophthora muscae]